MIGLALRMLFGEKAKYLLLLSGIAAATLMMVQGLSMGLGILTFSYATVENIRSPIWVMDPMAQQVNDYQPLRDTDVTRVRSVKGVSGAVPLYVGTVQARILDQGVSKSITLVGLDSTTLMGAPSQLIAGSVERLRETDSVIVDERSTTLLSSRPDRPLRLGDVFEMNDRTARIVGICKAKQAFGGGSFVYTVYDRAVQYANSQRKMVTHILVVPAKGSDPRAVTREITRETGLQAKTEEETKRGTVMWILTNSPIPLIIGLIIAVGFVIGTLISGQTFYSFVLENSRYLGALRAMGTEARTLSGMILLQALFVGLIGFGIGLGVICAVVLVIPADRAPLVIMWPIPLMVLTAITGICGFAAFLGIRRVNGIEPAIVFRG